MDKERRQLHINAMLGEATRMATTFSKATASSYRHAIQVARAELGERQVRDIVKGYMRLTKDPRDGKHRWMIWKEDVPVVCYDLAFAVSLKRLKERRQ